MQRKVGLHQNSANSEGNKEALEIRQRKMKLGKQERKNGHLVLGNV